MKIIKTTAYEKRSQQQTPAQWNQQKNQLFDDASKNPYKQNTQYNQPAQPVQQQSNVQLSRSEVVKAVRALRTLAMNISYFREQNTLALTGWVNKEANTLNTFLDGVEKNQTELDKALPSLAGRVVSAYKYVSQVWQQIGKQPAEIATLTWLKPFVEKWSVL